MRKYLGVLKNNALKKREKENLFPCFQPGELNLLFLICICPYNQNIPGKLVYPT